MIFHRPNSPLLQFLILEPLVFFAIISYFSFYTCASALPRTGEEPFQKTLELSRLNFYYIEEQPNYTQVNLRLTVVEDSTWYDNVLFGGDLERMRQDPDTVGFNYRKLVYPLNNSFQRKAASYPSWEKGNQPFSIHCIKLFPWITDSCNFKQIVSGLISQYDYLSERTSPSQEVGPPFRFALHLADQLPNYVTDEPKPDPPFLEDYMWLLDTSMTEGARFSRMNELHWRPWYETFHMDGPFRMQVFYIGTD